MTSKRYKKLMRAFYTFMYVESRDTDSPVPSKLFNQVVRGIRGNISDAIIDGKPCTRQFIAESIGLREVCLIKGREYPNGKKIRDDA